jgi:hypothetical protein
LCSFLKSWLDFGVVSLVANDAEVLKNANEVHLNQSGVTSLPQSGAFAPRALVLICIDILWCVHIILFAPKLIFQHLHLVTKSPAGTTLLP